MYINAEERLITLDNRTNFTIHVIFKNSDTMLLKILKPFSLTEGTLNMPHYRSINYAKSDSLTWHEVPHNNPYADTKFIFQESDNKEIVVYQQDYSTDYSATEITVHGSPRSMAIGR